MQPLKLTLRKKLTILFIAFGIIPMALVGYYNASLTWDQMERMTQSQLEGLCADRTAQLHAFFKNLLLNTHMLSDHRLLKDILVEYSNAYELHGVSGEAFKAVDAQYHRRLRDLNERYGFEDMLLVDTKGNVVVTATKSADWGTNLIQGAYSHTGAARCFQKASGSLKLVDLEFYPPAGKPAAFVGAPVISHVARMGYKEGEKIGVLIIRIPMDTINGIVQKELGLGDSGEIYLMGEDRLTRSALRLSKAIPLLSPLDSSKELAEAFQGKSGHKRNLPDYRGVPVSLAYAPFQTADLDWVVVAKKDESEISRPAVALRKQTLNIGVGIGLISLISALLFVRGIINPLTRMRLAANRIADGDLSARIKIESYGQVGQLAAAFNRMAERLMESRAEIEETNRSLERRVESRTEDLKKKTEDLGRSNHMLEAYGEILALLNAGYGLEVMLTHVAGSIARRRGAQIVVVYLCDREERVLTPVATYGVSMECIQTQFKVGNGIPGQTAADAKLILLEDVPEEYLRITSGILEGKPRQIACFPITFHEELVGVVELCQIDRFADEDLKFLDAVASQLGVGIYNALSLKQLKDLTLQLQDNNELLGVQNEELQSQNEEIQAQSEELQSQAEELEAQKLVLEDKNRMVMEANRLKSEFVSNMSHELRTPLNSILGMTRLMAAGATGEINPKQMEYLDVIDRNGRNLLLLIDDILDLSRVESGLMEICISELRLGAFVRDVAGAAQSLIQEKGLVLNTAIDEDLVFYCDKDKLRQILTNLLSNAIKFTEAGTIFIAGFVEVEDHQEVVVIRVTDTGIGIPREALGCIFDPFRQVDGSITRKYGGTGLGLNICKKLAEALNGRIEVASEPGKGSIFTLRLPKDGRKAFNREQDWQRKVKDVLFSHLQPAMPEPASSPYEGKADILLIDDDPISARELQLILETACYGLRIAFDGSEGLREIQKKHPDLLLLDLKMPEMDGFQVLDKMVRENILNFPVVVITAKDLVEGDKTRFPTSVKSVLVKGHVDRNVLLSTIEGALQQGDNPPARVQEAQGDRPRKILIVEDSADNMIFFSETLKPSGHILCTAGDGQQAVDVARAEKPDLILMDIHIPIISGYEAMQCIKGIAALRGIPIVALTARAMKGDRERILEAGFDDYLAKPVHPDDLIKKVEEWLRR